MTEAKYGKYGDQHPAVFLAGDYIRAVPKKMLKEWTKACTKACRAAPNNVLAASCLSALNAFQKGEPVDDVELLGLVVTMLRWETEDIIPWEGV